MCHRVIADKICARCGWKLGEAVVDFDACGQKCRTPSYRLSPEPVIDSVCQQCAFASRKSSFASSGSTASSPLFSPSTWLHPSTTGSDLYNSARLAVEDYGIRSGSFNVNVNRNGNGSGSGSGSGSNMSDDVDATHNAAEVFVPPPFFHNMRPSGRTVKNTVLVTGPATPADKAATTASRHRH